MSRFFTPNVWYVIFLHYSIYFFNNMTLLSGWQLFYHAATVSIVTHINNDFRIANKASFLSVFIFIAGIKEKRGRWEINIFSKAFMSDYKTRWLRKKTKIGTRQREPIHLFRKTRTILFLLFCQIWNDACQFKLKCIGCQRMKREEKGAGSDDNKKKGIGYRNGWHSRSQPLLFDFSFNSSHEIEGFF